MKVLQLLVSFAAAAGTGIQLRLSLMDFGATRKEAVDWWNAENALLAETPRLMRRRMGRELRSWRDPDMHRTIRDLKWAVASWTLLLAASVLAAYGALVSLID